MLPLKPPVSKKNLKDIKFLIYPIYDENGKIFDESSWPKYQGIFNGRIIVVNDSNDISRLCNLVGNIVIVFVQKFKLTFFILGLFWTIWCI
jgi:hypothetical protein